MCSVDGLRGMNLSTWRHCLNMKCYTVSHRSFANLQVTSQKRLIFYHVLYCTVFILLNIVCDECTVVSECNSIQIRLFLGNPTIAPRKLLRSQWFHEHYSCGSYTYVAKGCSGYDIDNLAEPLPPNGSNSKVQLPFQLFLI